MSFSLKALLAASAYIALVCAALFAPQAIWTQLLVLVTFLAVVFATTLAVFGARSLRPARGGFAIAAAAYLAMTVYPGDYRGFPTTPLFEWVSVRLLDTRVRLWTTTDDLVASRSAPLTGMAGGYSLQNSRRILITDGQQEIVTSFPLVVNGMAISERQRVLVYTAHENTSRAGHCAFALLLGLVCAVVASRAARRAAQSDARSEFAHQRDA